MITVEELIVQSIYHRLVLVTVRRSNGSADKSEGSHSADTDATHSGTATNDDANSTSHQSENSSQDLSAKGLGFLFLGSPGTASDQSLPVVRTLEHSGESVQITRHVHTVVDAGELQLGKLSNTSSCSTEVQTDFEPMWFFGQAGVPAGLVPSNSMVFQNMCSQGMIDMRNCDQFTVARLESINDPSAQSFVMVQSSGTCGEDKNCTNSRIPLALDTRQVSHLDSELSSPPGDNLVTMPTMFVGTDVQWRRESELHSAGLRGDLSEVSQHPADVDSGIWDMMQALGSGDDASRVDLFCPVADRSKNQSMADSANGCSNTNLTGTYRMYGYDETFQVENGSSDPCEAVYAGNSSCKKSDLSGGLSDILEPIAVVDFVVRRVETDIEHLERVVETPDGVHSKHGTPVKGVKQTSGHSRAVNRDKLRIQGNGVNDKQVNSTCNEGSGDQTVQSTDFSSEEESDAGSNRKPTVEVRASVDTAGVNDLDKKPKDVVEITSVRVARRSAKRRGAGRYRYWRDSQLKSRKTKSADTSPRCSSLIDVAHAPQELAAVVGTMSLAPSTELLNPVSPERAAKSALVGRNSSDSAPNYQQMQFESDSGTSRGRISSVPLSVGSLDWLVNATVRGGSALDLYAEPDWTDFEKYPDWMRDLPEVLHSLPLSKLCIPGSHIAVAIERDMRTDMDFSKCNYEMAEFLRKLPDLAVFNNFRTLMKTIWRSWMPKQCLSLHDQLMAGSRYIDMRITKHAGELFGEHGLYTRPLKLYLREIRQFVEEHSREVVMIHFQSTDFLERTDKRHLVTTLFQSFGARMACSTRTSSSGSNSPCALPSLTQLWSGGKQVVIFFPQADIELIHNHIFGSLVWSDEIVHLAASPKTQTVSDLISSLDSELIGSSVDGTKSLPGSGDPLKVVKAVLSPDMSMVFGRFEYHSMRELVTYETAAAVSRWLDGKVGCSLNVVVVDFIGIGEVVRKMMCINSDLARRLSAA